MSACEYDAPTTVLESYTFEELCRWGAVLVFQKGDPPRLQMSAYDVLISKGFSRQEAKVLWEGTYSERSAEHERED